MCLWWVLVKIENQYVVGRVNIVVEAINKSMYEETLRSVKVFLVHYETLVGQMMSAEKGVLQCGPWHICISLCWKNMAKCVLHFWCFLYWGECWYQVWTGSGAHWFHHLLHPWWYLLYSPTYLSSLRQIIPLTSALPSVLQLDLLVLFCILARQCSIPCLWR